jgi:hypothetical protein
MRTLALSKVLYHYGGMLVPSSYLALNNMSHLYNMGMNVDNKGCFVVESTNRNVSAEYVDAFPTHKFMGCNKHCPTMKEFMLYLERLNSRDYTDEQKFLGQADRKCYEFVLNGKMNMIDGRYVGIKDVNNKPVLIDDLLQSSYIDFDPNLQGILIPDKEILKRIKYEWFARMSPEQIYTSEIILAKYMLLSEDQPSA